MHPLKLCVNYHPNKRKNGELIDYSSQPKVMEVISKLSTAFHEVESEHQSQEVEISWASKAVMSELHLKYFDVVGYNKKRVLG
ncbi:unnamed protein product, partial [Cuscuta epithymum]